MTLEEINQNSPLSRAYKRLTENYNNVILSHSAALELLGYFSGYGNETEIEYYSDRDLNAENAICHLVPEGKMPNKVLRRYFIYCTDTDKTFEDILLDHDRIDDAVICESLGSYYYENGETFDNLNLSDEARAILASYADDAINYFNM